MKRPPSPTSLPSGSASRSVPLTIPLPAPLPAHRSGAARRAVPLRWARAAAPVLAPAASTLAMLAMLAMLATLAGCASPAPPTTLLSLPPAALTGPGGTADAAAPAASTVAADRIVVLRRVEVPEYLQSRRVRYRDNGATLAEWPNTVWAERLEVGVTREVAQALRAALPGWTVCAGSCGDVTPAAVLQLTLSPLEYRRAERRTDGRLHAELSRAVPGSATPALPQVLERDLSAPATGDTPQAQAESLAAWLQAAAQATAPLLLARP